MKTIGDLEEIKKIELSILKRVNAFCRQEGIEYFLAYGTLLGAVRHGGFIPWDDDIDIWMKREHYDRFVETFPAHAEKYGLFLNSPQTVTNYNRVFSKVCDAETELIETSTTNNYREGAFIDVFPVDALPDGRISSFIHLTRLQYYKVRCISVAARNPPSSHNKILQMFSSVIKRMLSRTDCARSIANYECVARQYLRGKQLCTAGPPGSMGRNIRLESRWFATPIMMGFEGQDYPVPTGYDSVLKSVYGDYMKLPSLEQRVPHHEFELKIA